MMVFSNAKLVGKCPSCSQYVYRSEGECSHCGHKFSEAEYKAIQREIWKKELKGYVFGVCVFMVLIGVFAILGKLGLININ